MYVLFKLLKRDIFSLLNTVHISCTISTLNGNYSFTTLAYYSKIGSAKTPSMFQS